MQTTNPTPQEALQALERLVSEMVSKFNSDEEYYWGGSNDSEMDHYRAYGLFYHATGLDIEDTSPCGWDVQGTKSDKKIVVDFYQWALKATEEEIVSKILELAKKNLKGN
tara:strand:- start:705 stop:1034 length:330 start_codon:yes stop_codon:yes gene_type:complete